MHARLILVPCLLALLSGCKLELPAVDTGTTELHTMVGDRDQVSAGQLTETQVKALVAWLRARPTGWDYRIEDTAPGLLVHLKRGGTTVLVVNIRDNVVKVKDLFRAITPDEQAALLAMLEPAISP